MAGIHPSLILAPEKPLSVSGWDHLVVRSTANSWIHGPQGSRVAGAYETVSLRIRSNDWRYSIRWCRPQSREVLDWPSHSIRSAECQGVLNQWETMKEQQYSLYHSWLRSERKIRSILFLFLHIKESGVKIHCDDEMNDKKQKKNKSISEFDTVLCQFAWIASFAFREDVRPQAWEVLDWPWFSHCVRAAGCWMHAEKD